MPVRVTVDMMLTLRKLKARDVAQQIGLSETQMSLLRNGKVRGMRFDTLARLCYVLDCKPGDLMDYDADPADIAERPVRYDD